MKAVPPIATTQLYGPPSLTGDISKGAKSAVLPAPRVRSDFQKALEYKVDGWLGAPGSDQRALMEKNFAGLIDPTTHHIDLSKLDESSQKELKRLQGAAEGFEAGFVKQLLGQLRQSSFSEKDSPTGRLAKDLLDQQLATSTASGANSLGIGKMVYQTMGERVVRQVVAQQISTSTAAETAKK